MRDDAQRAARHDRWLRPSWLWLLLAAVFAVAGCTAGPAGRGRPTEPSPRPTVARRTPGPARRTSRTADRQDIDAAYRRFWDVAQTLDRQPVDRWRPVLSQVAAEPLLTRVVDGLGGRLAAGYRQFGTVTTAPVVVDVTGDRASVLDCQDASHSGEIDTATGAVSSVGRVRTPVAATLVRSADGGWRVSDARYLPGDC